MLQKPSIKSSADYFLIAYIDPTPGRVTELLILRMYTTPRLPDATLSHNSDKVIRSPKAGSPQKLYSLKPLDSISICEIPP